MSDANRHMDEQFRRMSEELHANYRKEYWDEVSRLMENDSLDKAFREAASAYTANEVDGAKLASESLGDAFMDDAFREAASKVSIPYQSAYWNELEANRSDIEMDEAFHQASGALKANYNPIFWGDADAALKEEGLHYEYKSAYWNEARDLLDKADRRSFFYRWSGVAALLLLISFVGLNEFGVVEFTQNIKGLDGNKDLASQLVYGNQTEFNGVIDENEQLVAITNEDVNDANNPAESQFMNADDRGEAYDQNNDERVESSIVEQGIENDLVEENEELTEVILHDVVYNSEELGTDEQLENRGSIGVSDNNHLNNSTETDEFVFNQIRIEPLSVGVSKINQNFVQSISFRPPVIEKQPSLTKHSLAIIGRVGLGNSYGFESITTTPRYAAGLEYSVNGSGLLRNFEFGINTMLNYSTHENVRKEIKVDSFLLDGSSKNYWVSLRVFDLFYVNTNAFINYRIGLKHKVRFGMGVERLALVQSNMSYKIGDETGLETFNNNWGVKRGIAQWDLRCSFGYEYRLNKNLSMNVIGAFGFADRTANDFYSLEPIMDREMNIMFGVKYNLLTRIR